MRASAVEEQAPRRARSASVVAQGLDGGALESARLPSKLATHSNSRIQDARRTGRLEDQLASCEAELEALEERLTGLAAKIPRGRAAETSDDDEELGEEDGSGEETPIEAWKGDCQELVRRLEELAADALECGCKRDTMGAMDVFEQANAAVDRMAALLKKCTNAQVEAGSPEYCDPVEWRLVAQFVNNRLELDSLHALMDRVQEFSEHPAAASGGRLLRQPDTLLRFLRARDGSVEEAAEMFRTSLDWRESTAIQEWRMMWTAEMAAEESWRARLVKQFQVHRLLGTDHLGLPVFLFRWSVFDITGAERELGQEVVIRIILTIHEEIVAAMRSAMLEKQVLSTGALYVWDVGNYGRHGVPNWLSRMWALVRFLPRVAKLLESNYPEVIRKILVVRSGPATRALYHAVAPLMPSKTLRKCHLYGWRAADWLQDLRQEMPEGALPAFLERDDDDALAAAQPKGGIYPAGAAAVAQAAEEAHRAAARLSKAVAA